MVLDFGGQYNQLIARRVRQEQVYAEIRAYNKITTEEIKELGYKGVIFTGGPNSVYDEASPHFDPKLLDAGIPILGICYGHQLMAFMAGGEIASAENSSEYGKTTVFTEESALFKGVPGESICWMSHTDFVKTQPEGFKTIAHTEKCPCAAMCDESRKLYGVQFHPEVTHSEFGRQMLHNFIFEVCGCTADWVMDDFIDRTVAELKEKIGDKKVILGLSGGVDSSVVAALLSKAVGKQLTCVFVDHGLMRKDEGDMVEKTFTSLFDMNFVRVNCEDIFLEELGKTVSPEKKRKIIGREFYNVFWSEIRKENEKGFFAQGTIYPDCIESGKGKASTIKTHHNRVKIPNDIEFAGIIEPLKDLFKDEVRLVGEKLGIPHELVWRQPFPGPGLGVRIIGRITKEKIKIVQDADAIFREEVDNFGYAGKLSQYFAVITNVKSVGVMGDHRTYEYLIALRAVTTDDFMTADWAEIPRDLLVKVSSRITNEVEHVNRVVYDITSKPPATVEWE